MDQGLSFQSELGDDVLAMGADRPQSDAKSLGYGLCVKAVADQSQHLDFTSGELIEIWWLYLSGRIGEKSLNRLQQLLKGLGPVDDGNQAPLHLSLMPE